MTRSVEYEETAEFRKDFKKLRRRFKSLAEDLNLAKKATIELHHIHRIDNQSVFPIPNFCSEELLVYKIKKFACRSLKGKGVRSGIRVIYAFFPKQKKVVFIEIYFKGDRAVEDRHRIRNFLKSAAVG